MSTEEDAPCWKNDLFMKFRLIHQQENALMNTWKKHLNYNLFKNVLRLYFCASTCLYIPLVYLYVWTLDTNMNESMFIFIHVIYAFEYVISAMKLY